MVARRWRDLAALALLASPLAAAALLAGCQRAAAPARQPGRLRVAVSVPPLAYLVDRIGGARVETVVLAPPGSDPHAWEPSPRQLATLERADLYVAVGHPAFPFEGRYLAAWREGNPGLRVVTLAAGSASLAAAGNTDGVHGDPHVWAAPYTVAAAAPRIAEALIAADPAHAEAYRQDLAALLADVAAVDARLHEALDGHRGRAFLAYHAAWGHLAEQYGLRQLAVEWNGREPGPRQMVAVIEQARAAGVGVVFAQRGESPQGARALAAELDAEVVELDPLAYDWVASMRATAEALERTFDAG